MGELEPITQSPVRMPYTYVTAWRVIGGTNLPNDAPPLELHRSESCRFVVTKNPDDLLAEVDRGSAAGTMMLKALFHADKTAEFASALQAAIEEIRAARRTKNAAPTLLVTEGYGQADVTIRQSAERDGFIVTFDAVDKEPIKKAHRAEIEAIKLALAFEAAAPSRFEKLSEGMYFKDAQGRTVYSLTFSMSARAYVSSPLTEAVRDNVAARYLTVRDHPQLASVQRLYAQMAEHDDDPLKAFLFGWSALEIFIAKAFSEFEGQFMSPLLGGAQARLRSRFLAHIRDVMKDKYRLGEKFACVAAVLFEGEPEEQIQEEADRFARLKTLRDRLLHGDEVRERDLPVHELSGLLRKCVLAYLL